MFEISSETLTLRGRTKLWLTGAVGFHQAARLLHEHSKSGEMFHWPAFYVNLAFSYEHSLKAYLAFNGVEDEHLRTKFGHNLERAFDAACAAGYQAPSSDISEHLKIIGPLHLRHGLRYLEGKVVLLPGSDAEALQIAHSHILAVGAQMGIMDWD